MMHSMDVDDLAGFELVTDDFEEGEHERLDNLPLIRSLSQIVTPDDINNIAAYLLCAIVSDSGGRLDAKYKSNTECQALIDSKPRLRNLIFDGSKHGYKDVRLLKLLRPVPVPKAVLTSTAPLTAIEKGWEAKFIGPGADALWAHIQKWYNKREFTAGQHYQHFYAKCCSIVQSSGMGKSRAVDEMSKSHFVVLVNVREPTSTGFPPSDRAAYCYLSESLSQRDAFLRSCSFLHALFDCTARVVEDLKREGKADPIAEQFWNYMKKGMQIDTHGLQRVNFYKSVVTLAKDVYYKTYSLFFPLESPASHETDERLRSSTFPLREAFNRLCAVLEDQPVSQLQDDESLSKRMKSDTESGPPESPSVVLAFDEAHRLTKPGGGGIGTRQWSRFGEVCSTIRGLKQQPLFTLFISTSFSIIPTPGHGTFRKQDVMLPFCELGFDQLAKPLDFSKAVALSQVTSDEYLAAFGRPLWAPYWPPSGRQSIIAFAVFKLLGGTFQDDRPLDNGQRFACLAQRIPIEFLSAAYATEVSEEDKDQVLYHLRVALKFSDRLETVATMSPSEPVLSEAAYCMMTTTPFFNAPETLEIISYGFAINKSALGELVVALLCTLARDEAVGPPGPRSGRPRWCSVPKLLTCLFHTPDSPSDNHADIIHSHGWDVTAEGTKQFESSLDDTFKDSKVYFTHFIKVQQFSVVRVECLMRLMARGAAVLCAQGQHAIDGIIPFLMQGDEIRADNIGVIMFQAKNDAKYTDVPKEHLFRDMDPRFLGVISPAANLPVIRIVFALNAKTPTLSLVRHAPNFHSKTSAGYKTYDVWVAGLSPDLLVPVTTINVQNWTSILQASRGWQDIYSDQSESRAKLRKNANPGTQEDEECWEMWCDAVDV